MMSRRPPFRLPDLTGVRYRENYTYIIARTVPKKLPAAKKSYRA